MGIYLFIRVSDGVVWIEVPSGYGNDNTFDDVYVLWEMEDWEHYFDYTLKNWMVVPV